MRELKPLDYKLLFELMKDSCRSDRTLAKLLKSSQLLSQEEERSLKRAFLMGTPQYQDGRNLDILYLQSHLSKLNKFLGSKRGMKLLTRKGQDGS